MCAGAARGWLYGLCDEHRAEWEESERQMRRRRCMVCGTEFLANDRRHPWGGGLVAGLCGDECRKARNALKQRGRRADAAARRQSVACAGCGQAFKPSRSDARFCSTRCRVAAHRAL